MSAANARVSVFDKGFQVGDGVFDTFRILDGCPLEWTAHWKRFCTTAKRLGLKPTLTAAECVDEVGRLLARNRTRDAIARLHLTRGIGPRGYSTKDAHGPSFIITLHDAPQISPGLPREWKLGISDLPFPNCPELTRFKTASRVFHVLAKREADQKGFDDAVFLDSDRNVMEAISSNIFWISDGIVRTPPLEPGVLPGTTRDRVLKLCRKNGIQTKEVNASLDRVARADGVFLSVSTSGIIEVIQLGGRKLNRSPLVKQLHARLEEHHQRSAARYCARRRSSR